MSETHPILPAPHQEVPGDAEHASPTKGIEEIQLGPESEASKNLEQLILFLHVMLCFEAGATSYRKAAEIFEHVSLYKQTATDFTASQSTISRCIDRMEELFVTPSCREPLFKSKGHGWHKLPTQRCVALCTTVREFFLRHRIVTQTAMDAYLQLYASAHQELLAMRQKK